MHTNTYVVRSGNSIFSILQILFCIVLFIPLVDAAEIPIVISGEPIATVQIGANASPQEKFAASEIQTSIEKFTGARLPLHTNQQPTTTRTVIVLGTLNSNPTIRALQSEAKLDLPNEIGNEGYQIKSVDLGTELVIIVAAHTSRGVIYGAYGFIEACISALTGLTPVHPNIAVTLVSSLYVPFIDEASRPFFPVRAVLEIDDPDWLARQPCEYEWWRRCLDWNRN